MTLLEFIELDDPNNVKKITKGHPVFLRLKNGTVCSLVAEVNRWIAKSNELVYHVWNGCYYVYVTAHPRGDGGYTYAYCYRPTDDTQYPAEPASFRDFLKCAYGDIDRVGFEILRKLCNKPTDYPFWADVLELRGDLANEVR